MRCKIRRIKTVTLVTVLYGNNNKDSFMQPSVSKRDSNISLSRMYTLTLDFILISIRFRLKVPCIDSSQNFG